ncbi:MAG TPA: sodium/proton-translocating pyrophosphatase [Polyangiaceae bacterium]|nr:sodium/proton-translocating pyrophosphatase [Polyangiaceae bacterium]
MIELGLVVGIDVVGLLLALLMWRGVSVRDAGPATLRRLGSALERAARAFLWQEYRLIGIAIGVLLVPLVVVAATVDVAAGPASRLAVAFWGAAGVCLGALAGTLSGFFATVLAVRGSVRSTAAASAGVDAALGIAMRAGGAASLLAETLSGLLVAALFGLLFAIQGGFTLPAEQALGLARHVVLLLPGLALGATVSALVLQRGGGAFHAAGGVGSEQAGERDAGLDHDDPRNPAVVAELVGDHVGASATRALHGFASATVANVAAAMIGLSLASASQAGSDPLLWLALPLIVRAFGVIASTFGVVLVRSDETSNLSSALVRGYLSTTAISLSGLWGISYWLFGEHFLPVFVSGALGLVVMLLAAHALMLRLGRRDSVLRDGNEALRVGGGALVAAGLGAGLQTASLPLAIVGAALLTALGIGAHGGIASGPELSALMFTLAAISASPFVSAVETLGSIADGARGIASMIHADGDAKRRSSRLDDAGFLGSAVAHRYSVFASALSSLLIAWAIASQARALGTNNSLPPSLGASSSLSWCAALGAAVVLGYAGSVARAAVRGAREVAAEVERQLRGFPREHGVAQVPLEYTPSYKSCVELTTSVALRHALLPIVSGILVPVALGLGLRLAFFGLARELVPQGLSWFVVAASLTGLCAALALDAARTTLGNVRRANRGRESGYAFSASLTADAWSDIFGNAASPALQLLVKATAAAALSITPFLL